jgi:hypothetical protein
MDAVKGDPSNDGNRGDYSICPRFLERLGRDRYRFVGWDGLDKGSINAPILRGTTKDRQVRATTKQLEALEAHPAELVAKVRKDAGKRLAKAITIDDAFIREWHPKYDRTSYDEPEYRRLVAVVAEEMGSRGTISKETFLAIWKWKGAMRVINNVIMDEYDTRYAEAFRRAASEPPERKLAALLAPGVKLPGIEAPTGSTIIHFIDPQAMPIIDVRTVEVLFEADLVSTGRRDLGHYEEFRLAIKGIRRRCPSWKLREIDRALFAYHKQFLDKGH